MKSIIDRLSPTKPKELEKLQKIFEKSGCGEYFEAVMAEVKGPNVSDFSKKRVIVTRNYIVDCTGWINSIGNVIKVVPINDITKIYRSNISFLNGGEYNFDFFHLTVERRTSETMELMGATPRNKKVLEYFDDIIEDVKAKMAMEG